MDMVHVKNRSASVVVYNIPDANIRRTFSPGETKKLSCAELEQLTYQAGGIELLSNFLQILDDDVIREVGMAKPQPEYYMNEQQIVELIKTGSLDAFLDALDFAPQGVLDLIKKLSVQIPLNDLQKRKALKEKTGFDVDAAVKHIEEEKEDDSTTSTEAPKRKVATDAAPAGRRTTPQYNVVQVKEKVTE